MNSGLTIICKNIFILLKIRSRLAHFQPKSAQTCRNEMVHDLAQVVQIPNSESSSESPIPNPYPLFSLSLLLNYCLDSFRRFFFDLFLHQNVTVCAHQRLCEHYPGVK